MKRLFTLLLLLAPVMLLAQKKKKDKPTPEQKALTYLHDEQVKRGFDSLYMSVSGLAGKEDGYPELSKEMTVIVTTNAKSVKNFEAYAASIKDTLVAINKNYIDILLDVEGKKFKNQLEQRKYTETKTVYDVEYRGSGNNEGRSLAFSGSIYAPGRPW